MAMCAILHSFQKEVQSKTAGALQSSHWQPLMSTFTFFVGGSVHNGISAYQQSPLNLPG